ncbi:hypothetical protein RCL_jg6510.t1 [Rhizophagus clarus]|uniref:Uncharacterized protein n=1 Tax=Rhizophagus clarus TaxID=94130 RepID=A0A8H3LF16_9GLOM|nr:hypothetical protein RCL_jg6510.t1 [Rhizophagus clarus]
MLLVRKILKCHEYFKHCFCCLESPFEGLVYSVKWPMQFCVFCTSFRRTSSGGRRIILHRGALRDRLWKLFSFN